MKAKGDNEYTLISTAIIYYKMVRYKQDLKPVDLMQYQEKLNKPKLLI
jgi:hypothetical protein